MNIISLPRVDAFFWGLASGLGGLALLLVFLLAARIAARLPGARASFAELSRASLWAAAPAVGLGAVTWALLVVVSSPEGATELAALAANGAIPALVVGAVLGTVKLVQTSRPAPTVALAAGPSSVKKKKGP